MMANSGNGKDLYLQGKMGMAMVHISNQRDIRNLRGDAEAPVRRKRINLEIHWINVVQSSIPSPLVIICMQRSNGPTPCHALYFIRNSGEISVFCIGSSAVGRNPKPGWKKEAAQKPGVYDLESCPGVCGSRPRHLRFSLESGGPGTFGQPGEGPYPDVR